MIPTQPPPNIFYSSVLPFLSKEHSWFNCSYRFRLHPPKILNIFQGGKSCKKYDMFSFIQKKVLRGQMDLQMRRMHRIPITWSPEAKEEGWWVSSDSVSEWMTYRDAAHLKIKKNYFKTMLKVKRCEWIYQKDKVTPKVGGLRH